MVETRLHQSNRMQKFDFDSYVELLHVPNQMHTLRINYINYIYPRGLSVPSTWDAQGTSF